jgi:uncharacterized protein (DUF362 family)/Pyruvate/2-oxoacid:ferredoxin oxidoreductase delta subunit
MKSPVSILPCPDYSLDNVRRVIKKSFDNLGGLEKFVKKKDKVLIKPNLLSAKEPERAITTHPSIVQAVVEEVQRIGAIPWIGDSPGGADRGVKRVFDNTLTTQVAQDTGAKLVPFEGGGICERKAKSGKIYYIAKPACEADVIISLPKLKTHSFLLYTGAIKNMFGLIPGFRKAEYHKEAPKTYEFASVIVDIFSLRPPEISLMDAVVVMEGDGPSSGNPQYLGLILASTDAVALDTVAAKLFGFKNEEIETTIIAQKRGLGQNSFSQIEIVGEKLENILLPKFELPSNRMLRMIPKFAVKMIDPLIWIRPNIIEENCNNCNLCVDSCPMKAISPDKKRPQFDYDKCINCLCCHEVCPNQAVFLEKSWLAKKMVK